LKNSKGINADLKNELTALQVNQKKDEAARKVGEETAAKQAENDAMVEEYNRESANVLCKR
jgi:hypothetical protein